MVLPYYLIPLSPWWFLFIIRSGDLMVHGPLTSFSFVLWLSKDNRQVILITTLGIWIRCIWLKRPYLLDPYLFMVMVFFPFMVDLQECPTHSSLLGLWSLVFRIWDTLTAWSGFTMSKLPYFLSLCLVWAFAYYISFWCMEFPL